MMTKASTSIKETGVIYVCCTLYMSTSQKSNRTHKPPYTYSNPPTTIRIRIVVGDYWFYSVLCGFEYVLSKIIANGCSLDYTECKKGIKGGL